MVFFKGTQMLSDLPAIVAAAHAKGVPVIVDCAAQLPPRKNLTEVLATGADLVVFSGGKGFRGTNFIIWSFVVGLVLINCCICRATGFWSNHWQTRAGGRVPCKLSSERWASTWSQGRQGGDNGTSKGC